jgi:hypothetical protein
MHLAINYQHILPAHLVSILAETETAYLVKEKKEHYNNIPASFELLDGPLRFSLLTTMHHSNFNYSSYKIVKNEKACPQKWKCPANDLPDGIF